MAEDVIERAVRPGRAAVLTDGQRRRIGQAQGTRVSGAALRHMRLDAQFSQSNIAEALGLNNQDSVRRWEKGEASPNAQELVRFMVACGVTDISAVITGSE